MKTKYPIHRLNESESESDKLIAQIPYPRTTVEYTVDIEKIKDQLNNLPTAEEISSKVEKKKYPHLDGPLLAFYNSKVIDPNSDKPKDIVNPVIIDNLADFINVASYTELSTFPKDVKTLLYDARPKYMILAIAVNNIVYDSSIGAGMLR